MPAKPVTTTTLDADLLLQVLVEFKRGNFSVRMPANWTGLSGQIADALNDVIDSHERVVQELQRNAQLFSEAKEASRAKSDFLNMAAHELRTPLSVVTGYLSMLSDGTFGDAPDAWRKPIDVLSTKAYELNKLVDDLLMAARMDAAEVGARVADVDLCALALEATQRAEAQAAIRAGRIICQVPDGPVIVKGDPDHLARILDNLVGNALTYTVRRPWVRVAVAESGRIAVEDRGVGIPAEQRERVFERFFRLNHPEVGPQPGTGLGLHISRQLAERHGGTLVLEKSSSAGSTFVLQLPVLERPVDDATNGGGARRGETA